MTVGDVFVIVSLLGVIVSGVSMLVKAGPTWNAHVIREYQELRASDAEQERLARNIARLERELGIGE